MIDTIFQNLITHSFSAASFVRPASHESKLHPKRQNFAAFPFTDHRRPTVQGHQQDGIEVARPVQTFFRI
jgi:hypothetical protein